MEIKRGTESGSNRGACIRINRGKNHGILSYMIPDLCVGNNDFYSDLNDNGDCLLLFSVDIPAVF